jgi:molybdate transport system substrate-binding protein
LRRAGHGYENQKGNVKMNRFKQTRRTFLATTLALAAMALTVSGAYAQGKGEIIVSAAASLRNAFEEIGTIYEQRTGIKPNFNFAASGVLQQQIESGAPADVFASAAQKQMDDIEKKGLLLDGTREDFTGNSLVLIVPADSKLKLNSFQDLTDPKVKSIAIGNPKTVPAGQYAQDSLTALKLWDTLQSRFIPGDNVRQVLDYVSRDEVEAGLVYASDAAVGGNKIRIVATAPKGTHEEIVYPIAVLKDSKNSDAAKQYIELTQSRTAKDILAKYGFANPQ